MSQQVNNKRIETIATGRGRVRIWRKNGKVIRTKNLGKGWRKKSKWK